MFYRINDSCAISLDPESAISHIIIDKESVIVQFSSYTHQFGQYDHSDEYAAYKALISHMPRLIDYLEIQRLQDIREKHTHPELDEMPRTLFAIFQSLSPRIEGLELRLNQDGTGALFTKETNPRCIFTWNNFEEALQQLTKVGTQKNPMDY